MRFPVILLFTILLIALPTFGGPLFETNGIAGTQVYGSQPAMVMGSVQSVTSSHLPIVLIDTYGAQIPDEPKISAYMRIIHHADGRPNLITDQEFHYQGPIGIEVRGQSSQMFPKKSYGFETRNSVGGEDKVSLLGFGEHDDWVLYAPYSDKSMLRNDLTYAIGRQMGRWQPGAQFAEVILNGNYIGVYQLIERIKRGGDRLDLNKMGSSDNSGDALTGGYIFKVDKIHDLDLNDYFYTSPTYRYHNARTYAFSYDYPKSSNITTAQKEYLQYYLYTFENNLNAPWFTSETTGYRKFIDVGSFIDFQIINELTNNIDGYRYSTFFHKQRDSKGGKLVAGPLWDFDLGYGNLNYSSRHQLPQNWAYLNYGPNENYCMHWWARLMEDPKYEAELKLRWSELRQTILHTDTLMAYIDARVEELGSAVDRNFTQWPILGVWVWPNYFVGPTYETEVYSLKNWIKHRLNWMDDSWLLTTSYVLPVLEEQISVFPNPARESISIELAVQGNTRLQLFNSSGVKVKETQIEAFPGNMYPIDLTTLQPGVYILRIMVGKNPPSVHKIIRL